MKKEMRDEKISPFEKKFKKFGQKVIPKIIWMAIFLFVISIVILISWLITDKTIKILGQLILILIIIFITILVVIFTLLITKYKKEAILNDTERERKWASLSYGYKRLFRRMIYVGIGIYICMILVGIYSSLYPGQNSYWFEGILWSILGLTFLFSAFVQLKRLKKLDEKHKFKKIKKGG